ncbi:MAG: alpha/beta hydrolase-fold protein, partial [Gammaproteobacteria bacterium]|nr:alpha/beta hydrolase-fold protein [Gammaproteobacteria bacterium]
MASLSCAALLAAVPLSNTVAQQAAETPEYLAIRDVPHGTVQELNYESESLDKAREALVYLPPGYESSSDAYPVLYLLHGAGGDQRTWIDRQQAHVILDNLIADGELDPLVVVMPYGYTSRLPAGERRRGAEGYKQDMEEFAVDFVNDLVPLVESRYRVVG